MSSPAASPSALVPEPSTRSGGERVWRATLRLRKAHWRSLEDIADAMRKSGVSQQRPSHSEIVASVLDAVLPLITDVAANADDESNASRVDVAPTADLIRSTLAARLNAS